MKPLRSSLDVDNRTIKVEYENLGVICFKCGRIGHNKEFCKEGVVDMNEEETEPEESNTAGVAESETFGPWMQVSYDRNSRFYSGNNTTGKRNGYARKQAWSKS